MKKLKYLVLAAFLMIMPAVKAEGNYATVTDITNSDTLVSGSKQTVEGSGTAEATLTYTEGTFKLLPAGDNRPEGYAWIGFRVTVPASASSIKLDDENVTLDGDHYFDVYYGFNPTKLEASLRDGEEARVGSFVVTYTVDGNEVTQTINVVIVPDDIKIQAQDSTDEVWNDEIYTEIMDDIAAAEEEPEKDNSPKTGVVDYTLIAGIIAAASMAAYLDLKKRFN